MLPHLELIERIAVGAACGGLIGFERDLHGRHVGLRTHLIVAMTSALFMVLSAHFVFYQGYGAEQLVEVDASRIAASVVSGIGFLAGGAILRTGLSIQGMTTAAGLWLVTAIGMSAGAGMYIETGFVTLMGLLALTVLRRFEDKDDTIIRRKISLTLDNGEPDLLSRILRKIQDVEGSVGEIDYERNLIEGRTTAGFEIQIPMEFGLEKMTQFLESQPGVRSIRIHTTRQ